MNNNNASSSPPPPGLCIVPIPLWDTFRIHFQSFIYGMWVLCRRFMKWIWDPNSLFNLRSRDNPPACLVDSSLGCHRYVKLKGVKFHYVEQGDKNLPLLLLLHGFLDCWFSWRSQIPELSEHFRVVALDLKGFGDSDKPLWRVSYKIDKLLDELRQLIKSLGVSSCNIVGHDLGGLLGWYFVHQSPELVDKFVAVSCPHPNVYWEEQPSHCTFNAQWLKFSQLPYLPEIDALKEDLKVVNEYHQHLQALDKNKTEKESLLEAYKYTFSRKEDWTGPINYYRNLPFVRISADCDQIPVSTLLVTGNQDRFVRLESVVKSSEFCEKCDVKVVEGAGHFPHQENADYFNKLLMKFLIRRKPMQQNLLDKSPSKGGLMNRMFGAVSTTVNKYGNSVVDSVQKNGLSLTNIPTSIGGLMYNQIPAAAVTSVKD